MHNLLFYSSLVCFIGAFVSGFSIFLLRDRLAKKMNTTYPYIEKELENSDDPNIIKGYTELKQKTKARKRLSMFLVILFLILAFSSMIIKNM